MNRKGTVIRFIDYLDISDKAKAIAHELDAQIDLPLVFLIDHDYDKNIAGRHPMHPNEFWVLANHVSEQSEYERVLLSNIYRGVQDQKRYLHLAPSSNHKEKFSKIKDAHIRQQRIGYFYDLLRAISSLVSTIDAEQYLKSRGYSVSDNQKKLRFNDALNKLKEYLSIQKANPSYIAYDEVEAINAVDYARIASYNPSYYSELVSQIKRIKPSFAAIRCIDRINKIREAINQAELKYQTDTEIEVSDWLTLEIAKIMALGDKASPQRVYALMGKYPITHKYSADIYSFIPCDLPDSLALIRGMKCINECIALLRHSNIVIHNNSIPDVHANIILCDHENAYADKTGDSYFLSFSKGLLLRVLQSENEVDISEIPDMMVSVLSEKEIRKRICKYCFFIITTHEYAHIINGDCEPSVSTNLPEEQQNKEEIADKTGNMLFNRILPAQYRHDPRESFAQQLRKCGINAYLDSVLPRVAQKWCSNAYPRSKFDKK